MNQTIQLRPDEMAAQRPFTDPMLLDQYRRTLSYMVQQVRLLLDHPALAAPPLADGSPHIVHFNHPQRPTWLHRLLITRPERLRGERPLTIVGFFGQKRPDGDAALAHQFDRTLITEIPDHPGLLSYNTMALDAANYANLVIFADRVARDGWSGSEAHRQAVQQLSPNYYRSVTIVNGRLPHGLAAPDQLRLIRAKYYDYQGQPRWQAIREMANKNDR